MTNYRPLRELLVVCVIVASMVILLALAYK